jgi:hypothetical protein
VGYETPIKREATAAAPQKPKKESIIVKFRPDQEFPVGHKDLRPLLQRDGLILLSWAKWENFDGNLTRFYVVNWITSTGKHFHYATEPILRSELAGTAPQRKGDVYFYRGIYGRQMDLSYVSQKT